MKHVQVILDVLQAISSIQSSENKHQLFLLHQRLDSLWDLVDEHTVLAISVRIEKYLILYIGKSHGFDEGYDH